MKTIRPLLALALTLFFSLPALTADAPRTDIMRDASGKIVERWHWVRQSDRYWRVTVRDASGAILRIFVLPVAGDQKK